MKHNFKRDHRAYGGPVLSMCLNAPSFSEFMKDFEERWQQKCEALGYDDEITAHEASVADADDQGDSGGGDDAGLVGGETAHSGDSWGNNQCKRLRKHSLYG